MKRLQQLGVGATKKQAEILTELEEEILWKEVCLVTKDIVRHYCVLYGSLLCLEEWQRA